MEEKKMSIAKRIVSTLSLIIALSMILAACATSTPQVGS